MARGRPCASLGPMAPRSVPLKHTSPSTHTTRRMPRRLQSSTSRQRNRNRISLTLDLEETAAPPPARPSRLMVGREPQLVDLGPIRPRPSTAPALAAAAMVVDPAPTPLLALRPSRQACTFHRPRRPRLLRTPQLRQHRMASVSRRLHRRLRPRRLWPRRLRQRESRRTRRKSTPSLRFRRWITMTLRRPGQSCAKPSRF